MSQGNFDRDDWRRGQPASSQDLQDLAFWSPLWSQVGSPIGSQPGDDDRLARITAIARRLDAPGDVELFREGDSADTAYFLIAGRVSLSLRIPGRADAIVATLSAGELVGWSALLPARTWTATARALEPASLLAIPGEDLVEICELDHEIGYHVMRNALSAVAGRLRDTRLQLLDMFGKP